MKVSDAIATARDVITVKRVYADPYEKNGLTVIPAAIVGGGAGGGAGRDEKGQEGEGSGFGVTGRPAGAFVIEGNRVTVRMDPDTHRSRRSGCRPPPPPRRTPGGSRCFSARPNGVSTASARLHTNDPTNLVATGTARLSPHDRDVPEIGYELATARALSQLAHRVLESAADDISGVTHEPVSAAALEGGTDH